MVLAVAWMLRCSASAEQGAALLTRLVRLLGEAAAARLLSGSLAASSPLPLPLRWPMLEAGLSTPVGEP